MHLWESGESLETPELTFSAPSPLHGSSESSIPPGAGFPVFLGGVVYLRPNSKRLDIAPHLVLLPEEQDWNCDNKGCDPTIDIPDHGTCESCFSPKPGNRVNFGNDQLTF